MYNLIAAISEPLADEKIVKVIGNVSSTFKVLLGIMIFISVLLIIGIAIVKEKIKGEDNG